MSVVLEKEAPPGASLGPINRKRARYEKQQIVKDDRGRRMFHGAFTGGFIRAESSIDTVQGFKPKEFVSHRDQKRTDKASTFSHRPEDYMDEEDLGEFGIAPKKLRINNEYCSRETVAIQHQSASSIGERILKRIDLETINRNSSNNRRNLRKFNRSSPTKSYTEAYSLFEKRLAENSAKGHHGLGYQTLHEGVSSVIKSSKDKYPTQTNPLTAVLEDGKRLRISGQAFGTGVDHKLTDDYDIDDAYELNEIEFHDAKSTISRQSDKTKYTQQWLASTSDDIDPECLTGFVRVEQTDDSNSCDFIRKRYPEPEIEGSWREPEGDLTIPDQNPPRLEGAESETQHCGPIGSGGRSLAHRFLSGSEILLASDDIITKKTGLVHYNDLKKSSEQQAKKLAGKHDLKSDTSNPSPSITRTEFEWHPVSLLCKRFSVPNPYPNSSFVGVRSTTATEDNRCLVESSNPIPSSSTDIHKDDHCTKTQASYELKRSTFDVGSDYETEEDENSDRIIHPVYTNVVDSPRSDSDDGQTNVMQLIENMRSSNGNIEDKSLTLNSDSDDGDDIAIVPIEAPKPEVITIDSSSDSSCPSPRIEPFRHETTQELSSDSDAYGPPLPPPPI